MNYYPHHIGDYAKDTGHLSWDEDMAYTRLLRAYYSRERPIPPAETYRLARAVTKPHRDAVDSVLREFFTESPEGWRNKRADAEIAIALEKSDKARMSAEKRWHSNSSNADAMRTHSEGNAPNNQEPRTKNQEPKKRNNGNGRAFALPAWLPAEPWDAWLEVRKKLRAPNTERALKLAVIDLEKLRADGQDPAALLDQATKRGWRGIFPLAAGGAAPDYSSLMKEPNVAI